MNPKISPSILSVFSLCFGLASVLLIIFHIGYFQVPINYIFSFIIGLPAITLGLIAWKDPLISEQGSRLIRVSTISGIIMGAIGVLWLCFVVFSLFEALSHFNDMPSQY